MDLNLDGLALDTRQIQLDLILRSIFSDIHRRRVSKSALVPIAVGTLGEHAIDEMLHLGRQFLDG
jgi:hypothetical protein